MEGVFYKQMMSKCNGCFNIVEVIAWIGEEVLLEEVKTGLRYVLTGDEFLQFHEMLDFDCDLDKYEGINLETI